MHEKANSALRQRTITPRISYAAVAPRDYQRSQKSTTDSSQFQFPRDYRQRTPSFSSPETTDIAPRSFRSPETTGIAPRSFRSPETIDIVPRSFRSPETTDIAPRSFRSPETTDIAPRSFSSPETTGGAGPPGPSRAAGGRFGSACSDDTAPPSRPRGRRGRQSRRKERGFCVMQRSALRRRC